MSYISDFKSSALSLFKQATSSATGTGAFMPEISTEIGQRFSLADGRTVALVANGTTALSTGVLCQSPAEVTAHQKLAMTVPTAYPATAGLFQVLVTNGSTVLNENKFRGGYLIVASGTGIGQTLKIASHQAAAANATFVVTLEDAIITTLDATSKITLMQNPYDGIIISPDTTATGGPVGISLYPLAASVANTYDGTTGALTVTGTKQYGFILVKGVTSCLIDSTVTNVGYPLGVSKTTAGTMGVATLTTVPQIGISMQTLTSANNGLVYINL